MSILDSRANMDNFTARKAAYSAYSDRACFMAALIGALSTMVPSQDWERALETADTAMKCDAEAK